MPVKRRLPLLVFGAFAFGCADDPETPPGQFRVTFGHESEDWSAVPEATQVVIEKLEANGTRRTLASMPAPITEFAIEPKGVGRFELIASDDSGTRLLAGRSIWVEPAGLLGAQLPFLVGRTGAFMRPPGSLVVASVTDQHAAPLGARHVLLFNRDAQGLIHIHGYDFGYLWPHNTPARLSCPTLPCEVRSVATSGTLVLVLGPAWAIWFDTYTGTSGDAALPDGLDSYASVAGGRTLYTDDGQAFIVGATRGDEPSADVVHLDAFGSLRLARLLTPRAGASAVWIKGRGLVVSGGSAEGAGAEILAEGATAFTALPYPADSTEGAALVARSESELVRVGGRRDDTYAETVGLRLDCGADCALTAAGPVVELDRVGAYGIDDDEFVVAGDAADGQYTVIRIGDEAREVVPLREPRRGASTLLAPNGQILVVGGELDSGEPARTLELFNEP